MAAGFAGYWYNYGVRKHHRYFGHDLKRGDQWYGSHLADAGVYRQCL